MEVPNKEYKRIVYEKLWSTQMWKKVSIAYPWYCLVPTVSASSE